MIKRSVAILAAGVLWGAGLVAPASADSGLAEDVAGLTVAAEHRAGYDRDLFGDYDRDALLEANFADFPSCDGYHSRYDNECYEVGGGTTKEEADDHVDVDHVVALAEAWDSGAHAWSDAKRDRFAGDPANLSLLTDTLNQAKGDQDIAEWLPPYEPSVCHYVRTYVEVKVSYDLAVDNAEKTALTDLAARCDPGGDDQSDGDDGKGGDNGKDNDSPSPEPTDEASPSPVETTTPAAGSDQNGDQMPFTGSPLGRLALVAPALLAAGGATLGGLKLARSRS